MCGILGLLDPDLPADRLTALARPMMATLAHRGPDGEGVWAEDGIVLGHRRLAVRDPSPAAEQPMVSADGRWVLVYNGEIYNRAELAEGLTLRGTGDTEVLLEAIARDGLDRTLPRLIGMFAFALWHRPTRTLTLVRDRMGIKPLYWGRLGERLVFASELKALRALPGWTPEIDRPALAAYLRHNYVPAPRSIYAGIQKLLPGAALTVAPDDGPRARIWWDLRKIVTFPRRVDWAEEVAVAQLEQMLLDAVERRLVADVPVGAFLSGGIDSSLVTAMMQLASPRPVRTFSIGFAEDSHDESAHARAVADHLGTDHTELRVTPAQAQAVIPDLADIYDEPFADASQIPTALLCRLARSEVTVALSGDGGDELFAGYDRYFQAEALWRRLERVPPWMGRTAGHVLRGVPPRVWDLLSPSRRVTGHRLHKLADVLGQGRAVALYRQLVSQWPDPARLMPGVAEAPHWVWQSTPPAAGGCGGKAPPDLLSHLQFIDQVTYLPDDILVKVDRASMASGLEVRVPLIDHRLVELSWQMTQDLKLGPGRPKHLLRQILARHVPESLFARPKMGFGVPMDAWLRGPLRDWAEDLLDERRLKEGGLIAPGPVRRLWADHLAGRRNGQYPLWGILMLQDWLRRWG